MSAVRHSDPLYLCLDQGGHSSRALVIDGNGEAHASVSNAVSTRRTGDEVEHDPEELVNTLLQSATEALAAAIADKVIVLNSFQCCGYAGDKGLFVPELNEWATRFAKGEVPHDCKIGVSTVSTCASGLSERVGIPFVSVVSLLEQVSRAPA